jgi:GT2 family glycosyltransferase
MNKANGGFGQGNNIGASVSSGEVLFFLNADTRLLEPLFKMTYQKVANDNQLIVGYTLVDEKLQLNNSYSVFPQYYIFHVFFSLIKKLAFYLPNRVPFLNKMIWPWGAAFSMKRELFENSGCFDEQIFLCNEEPDLLMRIPCRKIKILRKKIIHLEGHTISKKIDRHLEYLKSTHYYFKKYGYNWSFFLWYTIFCSKIKRIFNNNSVRKELIDALNIYNS